MAQPPPPPGAPPPGGWAPPPAGQAYGYDPYAADRALADWAQQRGHALSSTPDHAWYQGWWPCVYAPRLERIGRELRIKLDDVTLQLIEGIEADQLKQAAGEANYLYAFVTSPRLSARVAVRSKAGGGTLNEISAGFGSLFGSAASAGGVLGDPTFEGRFDVTAPSRDEGNRALPMPLRQYLLQANFRGVIETRAGGLLCVLYDLRRFDNPAWIEQAIAGVGQTYRLACG